MHHCHPCFGGHKPVGPICTTAPVIHPAKQCVTHSFSTTVVPHIFPTHTTHVHHQQIKNQNFFPQTNSNVNVVDPGDPGSVGGFGGGWWIWRWICWWIWRRIWRWNVDHAVMAIITMGIKYHHLDQDRTYHHLDQDRMYHHLDQISDQTLVECLKSK